MNTLYEIVKPRVITQYEEVIANSITMPVSLENEVAEQLEGREETNLPRQLILPGFEALMLSSEE